MGRVQCAVVPVLLVAVLLPILAGCASPATGPQHPSRPTYAPNHPARRGARFGAAQPHSAVLSRYGLIDPASSRELDRALSKTEHRPAPSIRRRIEEFNVLKYAFVNPQTAEVALLGEYDPRFKTGPIPYRDLLADALRNPYPAFTLTHEPGNPGNRRIAQTLDADLTRVARDDSFGLEWMQRLFYPVLDSAVQTPERRLLEKRLKLQFGITPEAFAIHWARVRRKATTFANEQEYRTCRYVVGNLMAKAGIPTQVANGFVAIQWAQQHPTPEAAMEAYTLLGTLSKYNDIRQRAHRNEISLDTATLLLAAAAHEPILRALKVPEEQIRRLMSGLLAHPRSREHVSQATVRELINRKWNALATHTLSRRLFHGFRFSNAYLSHMYSLPAVTSGTNLYGNPSDSPIQRAMFEADYALKYITSAATGGEHMQVDVSYTPYLANKAALSGLAMRLPTSGLNRYWIAPGNVEISELGNASGVRFGATAVKIKAEVLASEGGDAQGDAFARRILNDYAAALSSVYDKCALDYPSFHTMKEVEKVIALARWVKGRDLRVALGEIRPAPVPVPERVEGFWGLTYIVNPKSSTDTITFWMQGGVDFGQEQGEEWVHVAPDPAAERDALECLAASTALAERSAAAAADGDLEAARDLAEKSAQAMTGSIDLADFRVPVPSEITDAVPPAAQQAAVSAAALQAIEANTSAIKRSRAEIAAAESRRTTEPTGYQQVAEASRASELAARESLTRLNRLLQAYRAAPADFRDLPLCIEGLTPKAPPAAAVSPTPVRKNWEAECALLAADLELTDRQIESTRLTLMRLNAAILSDREQFAEWEKSASDGFDRCVKLAADTAVNFGAGVLAERYAEIHAVARKLPYDAEGLVEKYRHLASLTKRLKEARATADYAELAQRENQTDLEMFKSFWDGIAQIADLLRLDETLPARLWKYGMLATDMAYNLTELRLGWRNVRQLEANNVRHAEAVKQLSERMRELVERQRKLRVQIRIAHERDKRASATAR